MTMEVIGVAIAFVGLGLIVGGVALIIVNAAM